MSLCFHCCASLSLHSMTVNEVSDPFLPCSARCQSEGVISLLTRDIDIYLAMVSEGQCVLVKMLSEH